MATSNITWIKGKRETPHVSFMWSLFELNISFLLQEFAASCEIVDQDVLLMTSREDHFIPYKLHDRQVALLSQAKSLTDRVFTRQESAQNHCQIGNLGLALRTMVA